ncbi:MAG: SDR family NAD(P)-dependent oxidoreductase [Anaerolineaceae bacterium]|nr:MAG: short-chain dehydrogenase [Chloroflexi bacterium HGW-Chloroflexi-8]
MKVANKVFVVTGGGNGIGRQIVLLLVQKGAQVAAVDISEQGLLETKGLAGDLSSKISTHVVNITDLKTVEGLVDQVTAFHGSVDGLINNAGIIQPFVLLNDLTYPQMERIMNVNFYGMLYMTKTFLPVLLKRPEAHIINLSSMGGFLPVPGQTLYGASKAAVKLLSEGLRSELLSTKIHVTVVFPGAIGTNIAVNSGVVTKEEAVSRDSGKIKFSTPEFAAQVIVDGIEKNKYHVLVGNDAKLMDFLSRLAPERAAKIIYGQMKSLLP